MLYRVDIEGSLSAYGVAIAILLAVGLLSKQNAGRERLAGLAFLAATFVAILANRSRFFGYAPSFNPDEALFAANAMRSTFGWVNWGTIDPTTSGPLNSIVLTWPYLFGGDITLYSGRLTAALLACGTVAFLYAGARRLMAPVWAMLSTLPVALFYVASANFEFVHFSSEQVPVFLIAGAVYFLLSTAVRPSLGHVAMAALMTGLIPFAKLQGLPWAAFLALALIATCWFSRAVSPPGRGRLVATAVVCGMLPTALFVIPLVFAGDFDDFLKSYFVQQYLRSAITEDASLLRLIKNMPTIVAMLWATAGMLATAVVVLAFNRSARSPAVAGPRKLALGLLALVAVPVALATVGLPRRDYPHYLQFLLPAASLLAMAAMSRMAGLPGWRPWGAAVLFGGVALLPFLAISGQEKGFIENATRSGGAFMTGTMTSPHSLAWLRPTPADAIVCWGWRPECHSDSAMKSATRDGTHENQLYPLSLQPYFRSRFLADFQNSRPDFVIDFVSPRVFGFNDPARYAIPTFPEFDRLIRADFEPMSRVVPMERCPRLYIRKARSVALSKTLVAFAGIEGPAEADTTPDAVDDRSTFETCTDYWLLPKGTTGALTIAFKAPSQVKSIAILNTAHGRSGDRATDRLRMSLMDGARTVTIKEVSMKRFPRWTEIELDSPQTASTLKLEILSYFGDGGGLNEVKVHAD